MGLSAYGGDPDVIAVLGEIERISLLLQRAASELKEAVFALPPTIFDFFPNPLPNFQVAFLGPGLAQTIENLAIRCRWASEQYFSTEAQLSHLFADAFSSVELLGNSSLSALPILSQGSKTLIASAASLAVLGLTGAPSGVKSVLVGQAVRILPAVAGAQGPRSMLQGIPIPDAAGSARLLATSTVGPASSLLDHARVLDTGYYNPVSSIRIRSYPTDSGNLHVVYVPGTQSFQLAGKNPLNITSNLTAMAGRSAPSQQAVEDALEQVGAGKGDEVLFVGHSQGALIAGNLASNPQKYDVAGLISFGGPIGHLNLHVPVVAIENSGDVVPGLGGKPNPMAENWVTVESDRDYPDLVSVHHMNAYLETSREMVGYENQGLRLVLEKLPKPSTLGTERLFEISRH